MTLQNFVDRVGPVVSASWLNRLDWESQVGVASGPVNAYVVSLGAFSASAPFALTQGLEIQFIPNSSNTGAVTVNVAASGVKAIVNYKGGALTGGEIVAGTLTNIAYNGTDWQLLGSGVTPEKARTARELLASVTPSDYDYSAGPLIDGRRYGFNGDGVTLNDTPMATAISVVTSSGGGTLLLPRGTYLFSAGFSLPESMIIQGVGKLTVTIKANGNFVLCTLPSAGSRNQLVNLTLEGTTQQGTGLQIGDTAHSGQHYLRSIRITGFDVGVRLAAALWTTFDDCLIDGNNYGVNFNAGSGSMYSTTVMFKNCVIRNNDRNGVGATSTPVRNQVISFYGGSIESNGSENPAIYPQVILGACGNYLFSCVYIESSAVTKPNGIDLNSCGLGEIAACYFNGTATAIIAAAGTTSSVFIHNCDFNGTATRCIDLPSCLQVFALHNEYDLTNNVINGATSIDMTSRPAQSVDIAAFSVSLTGCTTVPTGNVDGSIVGKTITLNVPLINGTSNTAACTVTGFPASVRPTATRACVIVVTDNGVTSWGRGLMDTSGVLTLNFQATAVFTAAGTKGINSCTLVYVQ